MLKKSVVLEGLIHIMLLRDWIKFGLAYVLLQPVRSSHEIAFRGINILNVELDCTLIFVFISVLHANVDPEKIPQVVSRTPGSFPRPDTRSEAGPIYDVIVCGGTLGIFVATALASKGLCVGVVERNILKGVLRSLWFKQLY